MFSTPDDIPCPSDTDDALRAAIQHLERGRAYLEVGRVEQAVSELSRAVALLPDDAEPRLLLAAASYQVGKYTQALHHADAALHLDPFDGWGHRLRFYVLRAQGKPKEAAKAAQSAAELDPEDPAALHALLHAHLDNRRKGEAQQTLHLLEAFAPDEADTYEAAAQVFLARRKFPDAEAAARKALAVDPESAYAFRYLGDALWGRKRRREAYAAYREAGLLAPNDAYVMAGISCRLAEHVFPGWLVYGREAVNVVGAFSVCWGVTVVIGQAAVGWTLAFFHLCATTLLYVLDDSMYLMYWRRVAWNEVPPDAQAFLWRAKLATVAPHHTLVVFTVSILTLIALTCLCLGYPVSIAPNRDAPMHYVAWPVLLVQFILFCRGFNAYTKAQEMVNRSKPAELLTSEEAEQLTEAEPEPAALLITPDVAAKGHGLPPLAQNPWATTRPVEEK